MHRFFESQRIFTSVIFLRNFITVRNVFGYSNYRDYVFSLSTSDDTMQKCHSSCVLKRKSVFPFNSSSHKSTQKRMRIFGNFQFKSLTIATDFSLLPKSMSQTNFLSPDFNIYCEIGICED